MGSTKLFFCSIFFILGSSLSFGQSWDWGADGAGAIKANDDGAGVATDKGGNAYISGYFTPTITFGNDTLNGIDAYLVKYNPTGNVIWARQLMDTNNGSGASSVATDNTGNVYMAGYFSGNAQAGLFSLSCSINDNNTFLAKYSANGNVLWAKQSRISPYAPYAQAEGISVATDKSGNVFMAGYFTDTVSFGSFVLKTLPDNFNIFLVKYDSSGNVLWANQSNIPSRISYNQVASVATDKWGNAYITGNFYDTISFNAITLISQGSTFIVKYSSEGNVLWAKQNSGSPNNSCTASCAVADQAGNVYVDGYFKDTAIFGGYALYSMGYSDNLFLTKYDTNGNVLWAKQSSSSGSNYAQATGLASDAHNHVYMSGITNNDTVIIGGYMLTSESWTVYPSAFLIRLDTSGIAECGLILINGAGGWDQNSIASDSTGTYIYMTTTIDLPVICGADTFSRFTGDGNPFVCRWQNCSADAGVNSIPTPVSSVSLFPNPNNGVFTLVIANEVKQSQVEVYNMLGEKVYSAALKQVQGDNSINLSGKPNGVYLYRVLTEDGKQIGTGKFIME